jgi:hypothetical protein
MYPKILAVRLNIDGTGKLTVFLGEQQELRFKAASNEIFKLNGEEFWEDRGAFKLMNNEVFAIRTLPFQIEFVGKYA